MIPHRSILSVVACGTLLAASASHLPAAELLRWKFTEGQTLQVAVEPHQQVAGEGG